MSYKQDYREIIKYIYCNDFMNELIIIVEFKIHILAYMLLRRLRRHDIYIISIIIYIFLYT